MLPDNDRLTTPCKRYAKINCCAAAQLFCEIKTAKFFFAPAPCRVPRTHGNTESKNVISTEAVSRVSNVQKCKNAAVARQGKRKINIPYRADMPPIGDIVLYLTASAAATYSRRLSLCGAAPLRSLHRSGSRLCGSVQAFRIPLRARRILRPLREGASRR